MKMKKKQKKKNKKKTKKTPSTEKKPVIFKYVHSDGNKESIKSVV